MKKDNLVELTYEQWFNYYKPIKNHFNKYNEDIQFDTHDEEFEFVKAKQKENPFMIWTLLGCGTIVQGLHWVNRLAYIVCEVPYDEKGSHCDFVNDGDEYDGSCPNCEENENIDLDIDKLGASGIPTIDCQDLKCDDCGHEFTIEATWKIL